MLPVKLYSQTCVEFALNTAAATPFLVVCFVELLCIFETESSCMVPMLASMCSGVPGMLHHTQRLADVFALSPPPQKPDALHSPWFDCLVYL